MHAAAIFNFNALVEKNEKQLHRVLAGPCYFRMYEAKKKKRLPKFQSKF